MPKRQNVLSPNYHTEDDPVAGDLNSDGLPDVVAASPIRLAAGKGTGPILHREKSSIIQLLVAESARLWSPHPEENARHSDLFSGFLQRARKSWTGWRMRQSEANCSPRSNSLIIRENTGNFRDFKAPGPA
jgi:hypothetical protein